MTLKWTIRIPVRKLKRIWQCSVTPIRRESVYTTVAQELIFKAMCETPVSISKQAAGITAVVLYENVGKSHTGMTARGVIDVYTAQPFYISLTNFGKFDVKLREHQNVS